MFMLLFHSMLQAVFYLKFTKYLPNYVASDFCFLDLLLDHGDGSSTLLRNFSKSVPDQTF
jgi:hypothetical protein